MEDIIVMNINLNLNIGPNVFLNIVNGSILEKQCMNFQLNVAINTQTIMFTGRFSIHRSFLE